MSFPTYPAYKDSGVKWLGEVPSHWHIFSLKRSVDGCKNGIWGNEPDGENDVAVIRVADFERNNLRVGLGKLTYRSVTPNEYSSRALQEGDLLIEKSGGGEKTLVGCVVLFTHEFKAVTSNFVARMRPLEHFDSKYLCYCFDSLYQGRVNYSAIKQTTGIQNLDSEAYLQERFCFPGVNEQTHIARFLDHETAKIDALIREQERLIELLQEKRQAVISHAVTKGLDPNVPMKDSGVEWLGEVPAHWVVAGFKKHLEPIVDYRGKTPTKTDSGAFLVTARNIKDGVINYSLSQEFIPESDYEGVMRRGAPRIGDVLFTTEAPLGEVAQVDDETIALAQRIIKFRGLPGVIDNSYLKLFLESAPFQNGLMIFATGSTALGIKSDRLGYLRQLVPPFVEQQEIVKLVTQKVKKYKQLIASVKEAIALMRERRSALIAAAVTGKIDVRNWQPPSDESAFDEEVRQAGMETTA
ncbi:restriction endonuclease subunit S [Vreelandella sulfidaeris]|jgi:type I restriction enzyme S subunit|uniref:Restriction endonuclease subunit S n=1 Tax=Vreelandella sulfidaeris TaxID=115553 RepID=A0A365TKJ6_9GAMM|nr:restriction endonuclease subunit S [Halomonas sulfidaeris]RBI66119.1 restriction endonuclease subunit S [Halomonas sulfidaeris]